MVYARSDVSSVTIPTTNGGCGNVHSRPVIAGAPVIIWKLDCPFCHPVLLKEVEASTMTWKDKEGKTHRVNTSTWADTEFRIPPTPDEEQVAVDMEHEAKRGMAAAMQGVAAEVMQKHTADRAAAVADSINADELRQAVERTKLLEAQLAEMREFINAGRQGGKAVTVENAIEPRVTATIPGSLIKVYGKCPSCGGQSERKNTKGRTPKCPECKEAQVST
jgi:hypothetical protein